MTRSRLLLVSVLVMALCAMLAAALCLPPPGAVAQGSNAFPPEVEDAIQAIMDQRTARSQPPGMVVRLETPDYYFVGVSGYADLVAETVMTPERAFRVGSITKLFTATVMMQLAEEGVLTLDDPLLLWLPDVAAQLPFGDRITLRQLLSHTSGVFSITDSPRYIDDLLSRAIIDEQTLAVTLPCATADPVDALQNYVYGYPARFEPGEPGQWSYSNTGFVLLGMVIEQATGNSLAESYRTRIFEPLALADTFLDCYEPATADVVHGYTGVQDELYDLTGLHEAFAWAAGGLVSTAPDLITFARALFTGELFSDPATLDTMTTPVPAAPYGLGVMVEGRQVFGHGGGIAGYSTWLQYFAASDTVLVILYNTDMVSADTLENAILNEVRPVLQQ